MLLAQHAGGQGVWRVARQYGHHSLGQDRAVVQLCGDLVHGGPGKLAARFYRAAVGVDDMGASISDKADISTYSHMFSCWETLFVIKAGMEAAGYQTIADRQKLVEAIEALTAMPLSQANPQGDKVFNGKTHQVFGHQHISKVTGGHLVRVHSTSIEDGMYPDEVDYTTQAF